MLNNTVDSIKKTKHKKLITMITAYDYLFAKIFDGKVDIILVGDSLNHSFNGKNDTLDITLDEMIYHAKAVCRGAKESMVVFDMPFGYYATKEEALKNAIKVYKSCNISAIKIEGGIEKADIVKALVDEKISVMGHIGLMPQAVRLDGGYKIKGKSEEEEQRLIKDAQAIESAGAFCIVCEGVKKEVATNIAKAVEIPIIGIGSGNEVDGQVLVWSDAFGFFREFKPKFVRRYCDGAEIIEKALLQYVNDVREKKFPSDEESY